MNHTNTISGDSHDRVDGRDKVTGTAKYTAEIAFPNLVYGVLVGSTIAKGVIKKIDTSQAEKAAGVISVITHKNSAKLFGLKKSKTAKKLDLGLRVFHSKDIVFNGQPIALVVADRLEQAQYAASLVKCTYEQAPHTTDFGTHLDQARPSSSKWLSDTKRGDITAWSNAPVKVDQAYTTPQEVHNPMEMHSTTAIWEGDEKLTVYDKNHAVQDIRDTLAKALKLEKEQVVVNSEFIGGGFGSGLRVWPHTFAAIIAAKMLKRPVRVSVTRPQMFTMTGYRPATAQKVSIGATKDGKIVGIKHEAIGQTSEYEEFAESVTGITKMLYACPNLETNYKVLPLTYSTPIWMRAPGEATGSFALETALDELAYSLNMDPVQLRKKNYAETHPDDNKPWSSNHLMECMETAAKQFMWADREPTPRMVSMGDWWVGTGMAVGSWSAWRAPATAKAVLDSKGNLLIQSATSDMGPGTSTTMVKIASDASGIPMGKIRFELGKSNLPPSPGQGGSVTVASVGSAVYDVCNEIKQKLLDIAVETLGETYKDAKIDDVFLFNGKMGIKGKPASLVTFADLMEKKNITEVEVTKTSSSGEEGGKYAFYSFGAHFAEVYVHKYTGAVRVTRFVSCVDAGRIINNKTASSQISGAVVMGIGMALMEEQHMDHQHGRLVANDFVGYHIPVQADVPNIDVLFVDKADPYLNKMGAKGLGEIGLIGAAAAIGNAVFHATGKRIRNLPITPDKLI
jgi:xanthine dehydrogenase YagR molybdenum-binding subunit